MLTLDGELVDSSADPSALVDDDRPRREPSRHRLDDAARGTRRRRRRRAGSGRAAGATWRPGKTTLTAGLVRAGFGYLSDEAVAFDWDTFDITAYAKPLSIDPGAWALFPQLEPHAPFDGDGYKASQWQVPPDAVRAGAVVRTARARYVVFPQYRAGADTRLEAISSAEAVVELAKNTFHFRTHGRRALDALARLVPSLDCYRLEVGDLDAAVAAISDLAGVPA